MVLGFYLASIWRYGPGMDDCVSDRLDALKEKDVDQE